MEFSLKLDKLEENELFSGHFVLRSFPAGVTQVKLISLHYTEAADHTLHNVCH